MSKRKDGNESVTLKMLELQGDGIALFLDVDPRALRTAQQKGVRTAQVNGRTVAMHYTKPEVRRSLALLRAALRAAVGGWQGKPDREHAWFYSVRYVYSSANQPKRLRGRLKTTRPDGDNLTKGLLDAITESGIAWADDAQAHCRGEFRLWGQEGEAAHIEVTLKRCEEGVMRR